LGEERGIEPHIPVFDKSERTDSTFSGDDFLAKKKRHSSDAAPRSLDILVSYELGPAQTGLPLTSLMFCFQLSLMTETTGAGIAT
jgi:hypothetical protein